MTDPALNPALVAGHLRAATAREAGLPDRIGAHLAEHGGYVAWSGGADSTVVVDLARRAVPAVPVVHFDSGLDFPETSGYLAMLAQRWALNYHVIPAEPDALTVLVASGAWDHTAPVNWDAPDLHEAVITRPARIAHDRFGPGEVWGLRAAESGGRRAALTPGAGMIRRTDGTVAYAPIWNWRPLDVTGYLTRHGIPENPVYGRLRALGATGKDLRVGMMIEPTGLEHGRARYLRRGWPEQFARLAAVLPRLREWA